MEEISKALGISFRAAARAIAYPTHFFSVYDLQGPDDDGDIYERLTTNRLSGSAEGAVIRMVTMKCLREEFMRLSQKDQEILGRCFGVYDYPKSDLREIAMRNRIKESGVERPKIRQSSGCRSGVWIALLGNCAGPDGWWRGQYQ